MTFFARAAQLAIKASGLMAVLRILAISLAGNLAEGALNPGLDKQVKEHESSGDLAGARTLLEEEAKQPASGGPAALADFLDRHSLPGARDAYRQWATDETDASKKQGALRQLVLLDYMQGKTTDLSADLARYKAGGGSDLQMPTRTISSNVYSSVTIPGPLRSFARMAALSSDLAPEDLLSALARNVVMNGFQAVSSNEALEPTEYLRLLVRYTNQARELQALTKSGNIVVPACDSEETANLLRILGYRMRGSCGADIVLETVNATRAFLTVDSGFPLTQLEQDLRANRRFELPFAPTTVPVLYNADYWLTALGRNGKPEFLDAFLSDPSLCRLYLGLSRLNRETADALRKQASASKLKVYSHVLDFFGGQFQVRNGAAVVPGSPKAWQSLVGVSPSNGGAFFEKMMGVDDGWLASYFDALMRLEGPATSYLTEPDRMKRFYDALRGKITTPGPARPVFRSSTELLLLTTSLRINAAGRPCIPGDINVWRTLFQKHPHGKYDGKLTRSAATWKADDDVLEALFALSRKSVENEPLTIFLALNDIDRGRQKPMSPALASRLAFSYRSFGSQYSIFAGTPSLSEESINRYLDLIAETGTIHESLLKADQTGTLQSLVGIWQILCRQGSISGPNQDASFKKILEPFGRGKQSAEIFEAGRSGVDMLLAAANASAGTGKKQDQLSELLVGRVQIGAEQPGPAANFLRIYDAQRLIPIDSLFTIADRLGKSTADAKVLAGINGQITRLEETQTLRSSLTSEERNMLSLGYWSERHIEQERKVDFGALLKNPDKKDVRGSLTPFLRDSLVGMLYAYYAPPGAQLLVTNPLFVRNHDFIGAQGMPMEWHTTEVSGSGWPSSAGGRLMGSLVSLPYAIAEAEQNFLTPTREQALIWGDLAPQMIVNVTVARWRNVDPVQVRWIALHLRRGKELLAAAALDPTLEKQVLEVLGHHAPPFRVEVIADYLHAGSFTRVAAEVPPAELYSLAEDSGLSGVSPDPTLQELNRLKAESGSKVTAEAIAAAFGTPKPTLTHSYQPTLLHLRTFPTLMGYSSRILAESWESSNMYYAALADELAIPVNQLDRYVPEWTRSTIENIFATHLEDWPALLRSLNVVGETARQHGSQQASVQGM